MMLEQEKNFGPDENFELEQKLSPTEQEELEQVLKNFARISQNRAFNAILEIRDTGASPEALLRCVLFAITRDGLARKDSSFVNDFIDALIRQQIFPEIEDKLEITRKQALLRIPATPHTEEKPVKINPTHLVNPPINTNETESIETVDFSIAHQKRQENLLELLRRREAGELNPNDYEIVHLYYLVESGQPITRKNIGNQAIAITQTEFEQLGGFEILLSNGEVMYCDPDDFRDYPDDKLIIFPDDLGDHEPQ